MVNEFGKLAKRLRIRRDMTLRAFTQFYGFDAGNISRIERGLFAPPQDQQYLRCYATALGIIKGTLLWQEFFDLAAIGAGRIPCDMRDDERLLPKLPVLFRALRGASDKQIDRFIELVRNS